MDSSDFSGGRTPVRTILHLDMDAFFASVEVLRDPTLRGKPVIVGGDGARGVVAACTYEARAYGVHSAMPSVRAKRMCPRAVFIGGDFSRYIEVSRKLHAILGEFTPLVEGISLDEAFMDVSGAGRLFGSGEEIGHELRRRVQADLGLSCSVGVAPVKMVAKLASEAAKPRATLVRGRPVIEPGKGVFVVNPGTELDFLWPLPLRALWGIGPATEKRLSDLGAHTVGDLARLPVEVVVARVGEASGRHLHELAWARDPREVVPEHGAKSVGHEQTYATDLTDRDRLNTEVVRLADGVAARLGESGLAGRTVTLKVRFADFRTITRSATEKTPLVGGPQIARIAKRLLAAVEPGPGIRLLGVSMSNLVEGAQLSFEDASADATISPAVDEVRRRFGSDAIGPASLVESGKVGVLRRGDQQWGPGRKSSPAGHEPTVPPEVGAEEQGGMVGDDNPNRGRRG
ncbi:MAG TPA: DNA polymerase IV [Acidimicrobiales bacterium]|nr:DNA polymerase IV [Acidimicrobiales bacterium]